MIAFKSVNGQNKTLLLEIQKPLKLTKMAKRKPKRKEMQPVEKREESAAVGEGEDDIRNNQEEIAHFRDVMLCFSFYLDPIFVFGLSALYEDGV